MMMVVQRAIVQSILLPWKPNAVIYLTPLRPLGPSRWKMSKFKTVPSKVTSYMGGPTTATATARSGSGDDDQHYYAEATGGSGAE